MRGTNRGCGAEENDYFGYIFGAKKYEQNGSYVPASLREVSVTVGAVPEHAFYGCVSLVSVSLPEDTALVSSYAFANCRSLTDISLPAGVTGIGSSAFYGCSSLDEIVLPASLTSIEFGAFQGCSGLDSAVFENASGWKTSSGAEIPQSDLSDVSLAVKCLTETYCYEYWRCEV